ncbi:hypothetical protein F2Q68_00021284 [Brassica cretica]|uniref:Uncharacterized protein n=1 Tax=Brassica cretica TaxID=69181 RepID=A0A8S9G0U3_BRACR|nr:hypothetical protein F2Q68_00021284 [Brassica cretica]
MAKSRRLKDKARRELRDRTDIGSSAPSSFAAEVKMDEMCMVMCGAWLCGSDGKWEFVVDKTNMARMIPVHEALTIKEIESRVFAEFKKSETSFNVALSYWPPDSKDLATGIKTSPRPAEKRCFGYGTAAPDMDGFETPRCSKKQRESGTKRKTVDLSSVGLKTNFINLDDFQLIEDVEKFEERLRSESNPTGGGDCNGMSDGIDSDYSGPEEIDERDVRPRGYDFEFWEPLIDGDLGGSNAVEVVFNDKEANGVAKLSEGSRSEPARGSSSGSGLKGEIPVMVGSNVTEAICMAVLFVVVVVMVWLHVAVVGSGYKVCHVRLATGLSLGCGVRSVLVMVMDHVVVVGVLCNKRCRGCGVDVTMLCWCLVGSWLVSSCHLAVPAP